MTTRTRALLTALLGLVFGSLVLFAAVSPALAQSEGQTTQGRFVQCTSTFATGDEAASGGAIGGSCDLCDFFALVNNATTCAVSFVLIVTTVFMLISGFLYLTSAGDEHRISQAKTSLKFAVIGFIIAMLSLIIVKTLFTVFVGQNAGLGTVACQVTEAPAAPGAPAPTPTPTPTPPVTPPTTPGDALTHDEALKRLNGINVTSSGNCSDKNNPNCTSLDGVRESTIDGINRFKQDSGCPVTITGGTEVGHSSAHSNGFKLDISLNSCVDNYITTNYRYVGNSSQGWRRYEDSFGNVYMREPDHWDIDFRGFNSQF